MESNSQEEINIYFHERIIQSLFSWKMRTLLSFWIMWKWMPMFILWCLSRMQRSSSICILGRLWRLLQLKLLIFWSWSKPEKLRNGRWMMKVDHKPQKMPLLPPPAPNYDHPPPYENKLYLISHLLPSISHIIIFNSNKRWLKSKALLIS